MTLDVALGAAWPEAVFHVLAHVPGDVAASCFDPRWIAFARPASERLREDVEVLARVLDDAALARVQALAWVFDEPPVAFADRELRELGAADVASADALAGACSVGDAAEVLRAAAELEVEHLESLPRQRIDLVDVEAALARVARAAPRLRSTPVRLVGPLPRRGRAFDGGAIFVGVPGIAGAETWHVAWQAAHEAMVLEAGRRPHAEAERYALAELRSRARAEGLADEHRRWLATVDVSAYGAIADEPDVTG